LDEGKRIASETTAKSPPREDEMKTRDSRTSRRRARRRLVTTLGDLITAAYDAVPGMGTQRVERALTLLTRSPLARHISPHVEFVR
jgi:hypothetical protein